MSAVLDAVDGVPAGVVVRPGSYEEVAEALREAQRHGHTVGVRGGGSKLSWGAAPRSVDVLVDTTGLDGVLEHNPGDLVVRAQAGVRLAALQQRVGATGQRLALDPPEEGATLGGVVAVNASGPARLRYGTVRDLLIGVTAVLADATIAMAGGKVVKNVAGYDLGKLYTGSLGTLGVVVETIWRLHPLPAATGVVTVGGLSPGSAGSLVQAVLHSAVVPTAIELDRTDGVATVAVLVEGSPAAVSDQVGRLRQLAGAAGGEPVDAEGPPDWYGRHPQGDVLLKLAFVPAALEVVLAALPPEAPVRGHAGTGVLFAAVPADGLAGRLLDLRAALRPHDGTVVVVDAPAEVKAGLDVWGPVGDALSLMRRVKDQFDPEHRLAPGRFVGGI